MIMEIDLERKLERRTKKAAEAEVKKLETYDLFLGVLRRHLSLFKNKALINKEWKDARDGRDDQDIYRRQSSEI